MSCQLSEKKPMLTRNFVTGNLSEPTTPLTARIPEKNYLSEAFHEEQKPYISDSLRPYYSTGRKMSNNQSIPAVKRVQRGFAPLANPGPSNYTPTSPLSPTTPQSFSALNRQNNRRPAGNMKLSGLPKYHPANFSSPGNSAAPLSPIASRSITSQPRPTRGSDAQQKLQQYRRDCLASAAKHSSLLSSGSYPTPSSPPRLTPLMSPGEPMTPLQLEGQGDYLFSETSSAVDGFDGREMVERLVQRENERRNFPEVRSGGSSPALSPAVSPAGGCR